MIYDNNYNNRHNILNIVIKMQQEHKKTQTHTFSVISIRFTI